MCYLVAKDRDAHGCFALKTTHGKHLVELKRELNKAVGYMNCTPFVRQYDILSNKWGVLLCQKEYQTSDIRQNSKNW